MSIRRMVPFSILLFFVIMGCSREKANMNSPGPNVVASFNGGVITKKQLREKFESLLPCCKERYQGEDGHRSLVKEMVLPEVISQAIKNKKIDLRENVRKELGNLTDELNMSFLHIKFHEEILNNNEKYKKLKEQYAYQKRILEGTPLSERYDRLTKLHQKIHPQMADEVTALTQNYIQRLRSESSITKNYNILKVKVTPDELKDFYRQHKEGLHGDEYRIPEKIKIQEIVFKINENEASCSICREEKEKEAASALMELKSGANFQTIAQNFGRDAVDSIRPRWITRGKEAEPVEKELFSLGRDEFSEVIKKDGGYSIVKVLEKQPGRFKSFEEILKPLEKEYRWQKGEAYLNQNKDAILFTINSKPYTIGDFIEEYTRTTPPHQCHHMKQMDKQEKKKESPQLCDLSHNNFEEQKSFVNRMIDKELIAEDAYSQLIHVEHKKEIEFLTMASLYPIFHREEMERLVQITDEMVEDYYQKHKEDYRYPAKAKLNMIVINGGENKEDKKRAYEKAMKAYQELKPSFFSFKKGKDFAEIAKKYSEDEETASKGGRLEVDVYECRNAIEYMLMHGFHKQIFKLGTGEISNVFEYGDDYYIIQVREMESKKQLSFEEARELAEKNLTDKKHRKVMENWEDDLLKSAGFVIYDQTFQDLLSETKENRKVKDS